MDMKSKVEQAWAERVKNFRYPDSEYYLAQAEFFIGAMTVMDECPPYWVICIGSGRKIINEPV